ncbi:MAG: hypothetical protein J6D34_07295 [Atopobiaceae bacterium]|nr:hypothetical protein [Atopobiaceae bacterium]
MRGAGWYVIQVETGREHVACEAILRACDNVQEGGNTGRTVLHECFSPRYRTQFKLHGEWHDEERLLLPGYVVAVTADPWGLARILRRVSGLTRILTMGETFVPLSDDDRNWIERWTTKGDRVIPMSVAYKEGDKIVVAEGPLKGLEAMITQVKRRQNLAKLEIHAGQMTIRTTVGLAVLPEKVEETKD